MDRFTKSSLPSSRHRFHDGCGSPLIDLGFRRGHLTFSDCQVIAVYFFWFSVSLIFWSGARSVCARFLRGRKHAYAHGRQHHRDSAIDPHVRPALSFLFGSWAGDASNLGIAANCLVMGVMLHQRKLVLFSGLPWKELGKAAITAVRCGLPEL